MKKPDVSFIIPAYNSGKTLEDCITGLAAQTVKDWEAVICDDGSKDDTFAVATALALRDPRIKVIQQQNAGASAARNAAVNQAAADFICMLDSDDWLDPRFLQVMVPVARAAGGQSIAYCSYYYATQDKQPIYIDWAPDLSGDQARIVLSEECPIAIHAALVPRLAYLDVGGMNEKLATCEDWELWMRFAFAGVAFVEVKQSLAYYRQHLGTLSGNPANVVRDAVEVVKLSRAYMTRDFPILYNARNDLDRELRIAIWYTSLFAARGVDPHALFKFVPPLMERYDKDEHTAELVVGGLIQGSLGKSKADSIQNRALWEPSIEVMLGILEDFSMPGFKRRVWSEIARRLQRGSGVDRPWLIAHVIVAPVDVGNFRAIAKPPGADVAILEFVKGGKSAGLQEIPVYSDLSVQDLRRALSRNIHPRTWKWLGNPKIYKPLAKAIYNKRQALTQLLQKGTGRKRQLRDFVGEIVDAVHFDPQLTLVRSQAVNAIVSRAKEVPIAIGPRRSQNTLKTEAIDKTIAEGNAQKQEFWENFFETEDPWDYLSVYETKKYEQTLELIPARVGKALEIACAEGVFTSRLRERADHLIATDISTKALQRAEKRCGVDGGLAFQQLDLNNDTLPVELDLIVCSEVLYYLKDERELAKVAEKIFAALAPGGVFVTAHAHLLTDEPHRTGFDWGDPYGIETIRKVFAGINGFALEETIDTELYAIHRFRKQRAEHVSPNAIVRTEDYGKPLLPAVSDYVIWGGVTTSRSAAWNSERTGTVPVLLYHRISPIETQGPVETWISPDAFEKQLVFLRREGFYGVTSSWLEKNVRSGHSFKGRPVMITFDGGYQDFNDYAFPLLQKYNFAAEVFLVTDSIGQTASWNGGPDRHQKLMDWDTIGKLWDDDIRFGSQLCTHRPAPSLASEELLFEAVRSKAILEKVFGSAIGSIALPYGSYDRRMPELLRSAGYNIVFAALPGLATPKTSLMRVPRYRIDGQMSAESFAEIVGRM